MTVGENVKRIRMAQKMKRKELGARMGYKPGSSAVADLEHDRSPNPRLDTIVRAALALNVSVEDLITGVNDLYDRVQKRDQSSHSQRLKSAPSQESADVVVAVEARALELIEEKYAGFFDRIAEHASQLVELGVALRKGTPLVGSSSGRGKSPRKNRGQSA